MFMNISTIANVFFNPDGSINLEKTLPALKEQLQERVNSQKSLAQPIIDILESEKSFVNEKILIDSVVQSSLGAKASLDDFAKTRASVTAFIQENKPRVGNGATMKSMFLSQKGKNGGLQLLDKALKINSQKAK